MDRSRIADELIVLREVLTRELETINTYQRLLDQTGIPEVQHFIEHITEEEKEHVAEALELIKKYDPSQAALILSGHRDRPASSDTGKANRLTVGNLRDSRS